MKAEILIFEQIVCQLFNKFISKFGLLLEERYGENVLP